MVKIELDHLSYSSITSFLDCPENWKRRYIDKQPTVSSPALVFGSAFHGAVERAVATGADVTSVWGEEWAAATQNKAIFWGTETPEGTFNEGVRLFNAPVVREAIASIKPMIDERGPRIERKVEYRVPGVPIPVIGYIDIILEDGTPADFKTSARAWSDDKAESSLQSLFYLAALNQAGEKINWRFKHIVFVKTKEAKVQFIDHSHTPGELFFLGELVRRVWDAINTGVYPMNPTGWKCGPTYCDFYADCRGKYG